MSSPNSHAARLARVKGLSIRRSNAALPDAVGPRPDTSRRAVSGGEGGQGIETEAAARGADGPEPPPARNEGMVATAGSTTLVKGRILIPEGIKDHVHKRAVQLYKCLRELLKKAKLLTPSKICNTLYFPQDGPNMKLIHEYFEHGTISAERFEVELSMYNQIDW